MNSLKKAILAVLITCVLVTGVSGCVKRTSVDSNVENKPITMKFVFVGVGKMMDSTLVWEKFNQELQKFLPNTNVEFEVIPFSDYDEKWRLMAAAKETVDIAWEGYMQNFDEEVQKGSYIELDNLINKNTTELKKELPDWIFELGKVNGKVYCIPNYQMMVSLPRGTRVHRESAAKFLDEQKITQLFSEERARTKEDFKIFDDYLSKLKENGELKKGVSPSFIDTFIRKIGMPESLELIIANAVISYKDKNIKVYNSLTDFPENEKSYELLNEWYNKGYIRKDIMSLQNQLEDEGKKDGYAMWVHSSFKGSSEAETKKCGFPVDVIPMNQKLYIPSSKSTTNLTIPATAQDPVCSIKLIELLNTKKGKDLYNLLVYGIEGTHYNKISENRIEWLGNKQPGTSIDNKYGYYGWTLGNTFNSYESQYDIEGWNEYIEKDINGKAEKSPLMGFSLNTKPIKLELAQYNAVIREYKYLEVTSCDNYKELLKERNEKLKNAGSDKIVAEVQRQVDEWLKNK